MTQKALDLKLVTAKKLAENVWLVGWMFQSEKSGKDTVLALADLYHAFDEKQKAVIQPADGETAP